MEVDVHSSVEVITKISVRMGDTKRGILVVSHRSLDPHEIDMIVCQLKECAAYTVYEGEKYISTTLQSLGIYT